MSDSNEKLKWLKPLLRLFIFTLLSSTVCGENSTDYTTDDDTGDLESFLFIQPRPEFLPECGVNEMYQSCEVGCIDCESRGLCEAQNCHISHCDCRLSFVHLTPGGPCEHVSKCPPRECPENEVYRHCGPFCEYCDMAPCREMDCSSRCYCKKGYRRDRETGKCVLEKECPQRLTCIANDAVALNGSVSEHCLQTEWEAQRVNETMEEEKCYCPTGFKRNVHGWCIEEPLCEYVECYGGTTFQDCPRKCNTTCWNYGDPKCEEDGQCYPSCFCPEGSVLNQFFACVPLEMCPPGSNPYAPPLPLPVAMPIIEPTLEDVSNASAAATAESGSAAAAVSSSSGTGSSSAATAESSSGTGSSSAATAESSPGTGSSSAVAESSSGSGSAAAVSSSSGTESSSAAATETSTDSESSSGVSEKTKEGEMETTPEGGTTQAPKKPPKKATKNGKIYKSAARPGKTAAAEEE